METANNSREYHLVKQLATTTGLVETTRNTEKNHENILLRISFQLMFSSEFDRTLINFFQLNAQCLLVFLLGAKILLWLVSFIWLFSCDLCWCRGLALQCYILCFSVTELISEIFENEYAMFEKSKLEMEHSLWNQLRSLICMPLVWWACVDVFLLVRSVSPHSSPGYVHKMFVVICSTMWTDVC